MSRLACLCLLLLTAASLAAPVPKSLKAKPVVRKKIEPRPGEKLHAVEFNDAPLKEVGDKLETLTGLMCLTEKVPDLRVTLRTAEKVCASELFALVNDELLPNGYVLARRTVSFTVLKVDAPLDRKACPVIASDDLAGRTPDEPVQWILSAWDQEGVDLGLKLGEGIKHHWFEVKLLGTSSLLVMGRAADVQQFRDECEPVIERTKAAWAEMKRRLKDLKDHPPRGWGR